jgi:hypothetical protein
MASVIGFMIAYSTETDHRIRRMPIAESRQSDHLFR